MNAPAALLRHQALGALGEFRDDVYDRQNMYRPYIPRTCEVEASLDSKTQGASSPGDWIGCLWREADIERVTYV